MSVVEPSHATTFSSALANASASLFEGTHDAAEVLESQMGGFPPVGLAPGFGHGPHSTSAGSSHPEGAEGLIAREASFPQFQTTSTAAAPTQSERNRQRLLQRVEKTEAENEKLRKASRDNRGDLIQVERLLEEVLATSALPEEAYNGISRAADMLMVMKGRL